MNEHTEYLIKWLHQVFDSEQKERHNGGFGVPKPFKSINDTVYGQVIEELQRLSDENENLKQTLCDGNIEREKEGEAMYKTETPNWHLNMAERHVEKLSQENEALREALQLKEAECEALGSDLSRIVSAAVGAYLSGSEQQHVDHLYRAIRDASGKLYSD